MSHLAPAASAKSFPKWAMGVGMGVVLRKQPDPTPGGRGLDPNSPSLPPVGSTAPLTGPRLHPAPVRGGLHFEGSPDHTYRPVPAHLSAKVPALLSGLQD